MLVLSRRAQQQISFPNLGVTLSILQVKGRIVKVGIQAPPEITVLRQESLENAPPEQPKSGAYDAVKPKRSTSSTDDAEHWRRNQLNTLGLYLDVIQMRLDQGQTEDAKSVLETLISNLGKDNRKFAPAMLSETPSSAPSQDESPVHVLVVEDSDNERGLLTLLLAKYGFVVHVARDGAEALEQLQQWTILPDVILMDMQMPMFNGLQALLRIRENERMRDVIVYAVTGSRRVRDHEPVGRSWDRWFAKPVDVEQLVHAITEDCARMRSGQSEVQDDGNQGDGGETPGEKIGSARSLDGNNLAENGVGGNGVGSCRFS
ncbi:response regulator [Aporhodopirellula aestuarii]|uniref:Response regulator n=1 Tax=Aporhodopirellula aestuarii TaxID=2950107 RepID=A0ABT0U519_9BACT|nr:response regulator [Aporhodopirellula aestuarii]MCM2371998.1 response regulator [Aporhodopirellula aestuarii]